MVEPIVELSEGKIRGCIGQNICGETIYKFLGIPYGKPPIGELRFKDEAGSFQGEPQGNSWKPAGHVKAPVPAEPWQGIKDTTKDGDACYNRDKIHEHGEIIQGGEDCLVLNVFTRNITETDNLKPVMVYIHGGGFVMGSNKSEIYGPELLLTQDVVLVNINYRLGLLGFLSLDDASLDIPGNAGLKDQNLALNWVQKNIKNFGGDPNNVTIFGESAGSVSVHFHVLSPSSKGLFHKAILQSGVALCSWALISSTAPNLAETLGKKDATDREVYDLIKDMTGEEVFALQEKIQNPIKFGMQKPYGPVIEKPNKSAFLTTHPFELITSGNYNHVPLFIGYTSHEGMMLELVRKWIPNLDSIYTYRASIPWFMKVTDEQADKIVELMENVYSKIEEPRNRDTVMMDSTMLSTIVTAIINHSKTSKYPIYVYRISVDCQRNFLKHTHNMQALHGTCHADELGFLWNIQTLPKIEQNTLESLTAQRFVKFWTNFAAYGNPTPSNDFGVTLPPIKDINNITLLDIGEELTILNDFPERDRVELWKKIFQFSSETINFL